MDLLKVLRLYRKVCVSYPKSQTIIRPDIRWTSTAADKKEEEAVYSLVEDDYEVNMLQKEQELEKKRNKSRLCPQHRNIIHGKVPYKEPMDDVHLTVRYNRKMFGTYGKQSNVNPGALWPNPDDIKKALDYERIAYPFTIQEMIAKQKEALAKQQQDMEERQKKILSNISKLQQWKKEIEARAAKKLADLAKAKAKKDALIEEVRKHFGYKVDPKDEKFKEMLLMKERAEKKKLKEERSKAKQERLMSEMMKKDS